MRLHEQGQYVWDISELSHERVEYAFKVNGWCSRGRSSAPPLAGIFATMPSNRQSQHTAAQLAVTY